MDGLVWVRQDNAVWDADKDRVIGGAPDGVFDITWAAGDLLPGDWWAAVAGKDIVGSGWLDATWGGDAEILLSVDPARQLDGVGAFVLQHLEQEAARRGMNYVYNTVRDSHPDHDVVHDWLAGKGYRGGVNDPALRKHVRLDDSITDEPAAAAPKHPPELRPPGHEESGGYVDVEDHQY